MAMAFEGFCLRKEVRMRPKWSFFSGRGQDDGLGPQEALCQEAPLERLKGAGGPTGVSLQGSA